jgi:hypothetical protein
MAANTAPIFTNVPIIGRGLWQNSTTANADSDGSGTIGTDMILLVTPTTAGAFLNRVRFSPAATAASTGTTSSVHRLFLSTQSSGATTSANTSLIAELACPAQTAAAPTAATLALDLPLGFYLPSGVQLLWSMHHVAAASTVWHAVAFGGQY